MVLDAKTIFVRPLQLDQLFTDQMQLTVGQLPVYDVFEPSRRIVNSVYDIDMPVQAGPGGVPFFFHNDSVRFLIADTTIKTRESFPTWFQRQGVLTEFILYSGFCQFKYGSIDTFYSKQNTLGKIVNVCHSETEQFDRKFKIMQDPHTLTVSVHRNAWTQLTDAQRTAYRMFLIDRGQFTAWELQ
jgi:hypothetical protein